MADGSGPTLEELFAKAIELHETARRQFLAELATRDPQVARGLASLLDADALPTIAPLRSAPLQLATVCEHPPWDQQPAPSHIGPYELLEPVGQGGFGVVYKARQTEPVQRIVAVKLIQPGLASPGATRRFLRERRALALLEHPNIARLIEAGETPEGRPYVVIEFVDGPTLADYCREQGLDIGDRLRLFLGACDAIVHAHQRAVIHRDIKQSNILVAQSTSGGACAKVIDFGIADFVRTQQDARTRITAAGQFIGTPEYMSPEQLTGRERQADTRADVYSLGVVLYELLTGELPRTRAQVIAMSMSGDAARLPDVPRPRSLMGSASPVAHAVLRAGPRGDLDWIVLKALEQDPVNRYASVSDLAQDLRRYLADEPILARPPTFRERAARMYRRNPTAVIAISLAVTTLMLGSVGSLIGLMLARAASREAARASVLARIGEERAEEALRLAEARRHEAEFAADAASLSSAGSAFDGPTSASAMERLRAVPQERRGWEWFALAARADAANHVHSLSGGAIQHLRIHSGSALMAVCLPTEMGGAVVLLDTDTWQERWRCELMRPQASDFSHDGTELYVAGDHLYVIDVATGSAAAMELQTAPLATVRCSPDGAHVAMAERIGADSRLLLLDRATGQLERLAAPAFMDVSWSPDSRLIASGGTAGQLSVWNVAERRMQYSDQLTDGLVSSVAFSHDGTLLAVAERRGAIRLLDTAEWRQKAIAVAGCTGVFRVEFTADDARFIVTGGDGLVAEYEVGAFGSVRDGESRVLRGHQSLVHALACGAEGRALFTGSYDGQIRAWDATAAPADLVNQRGPTLCFSRDGRQYAVSNGPQRIDVYSVEQLRALHTVELPAGAGKAVFAADGQELVYKIDDRIESIAVAGGMRRQIALLDRDVPGEVRDISPDGNYAAVWIYYYGTLVVDLRAGTTVWGRPAPRAGETVRYASTGELLCLGLGGDIELWDPLTDRMQRRYAHPGDSKCYAAEFTRDGRFLVCASFDSRIVLFDATTAECLGSSALLSGFPGSLMLTPDSARAITLGEDGVAKISEIPTLRRICDVRASSIWASGILSPDGGLLVIAGSDRRLRRWHVPLPENRKDAVFLK